MVQLLPDLCGYYLLLALSGKTTELALAPRELEAMKLAKPFRYGPDREHCAFEWGVGPLVLLVHGWGGRAGQMAPLACSLANQGFRCVAFDITGNGASGRRSTRWSYFLRDIAAVTKSLNDDVFAYIGHSSGGTTMMATRRRGQIGAKHYVCICTPSYPFLSLDSVRQRFEPRESLLSRYKTYLENEFGIAWHELEDGGSFTGVGENLLLIYDERDRLVPHSEGDRIQKLCTGSTLIKTRYYGHRRILTAPELHSTVSEFLKREGEPVEPIGRQSSR